MLFKVPITWSMSGYFLVDGVSKIDVKDIVQKNFDGEFDINRALYPEYIENSLLVDDKGVKPNDDGCDNYYYHNIIIYHKKGGVHNTHCARFNSLGHMIVTVNRWNNSLSEYHYVPVGEVTREEWGNSIYIADFAKI